MRHYITHSIGYPMEIGIKKTHRGCTNLETTKQENSSILLRRLITVTGRQNILIFDGADIHFLFWTIFLFTVIFIF
jgi:hypothetical protein